MLSLLKPIYLKWMFYVGFWSFCTNAGWFLEEAIYRNWLASLSSATPLPLSPVNSEAMPCDDQDWPAKGDILCICYHIWEEKMWSNCLKCRQGICVVWLVLLAWSVEIRNHFFVDFYSVTERVQKEMSDVLTGEKRESRKKHLWFVGSHLMSNDIIRRKTWHF